MQHHALVCLALSSSLLLLPKIALAEDDKNQIMQGVTLSGLVEIEATYEEVDDENSSDIAVATVELGIEAKINPWVSSNVLLKYEDTGEEDDEKVFVDEAFITLANESVPYSLKAGRLYVPFGNFETQLISDPLVLDLGEARETALQLGFAQNGIYANAYLFNGDTQKADSENNIDQYGVNLGYTFEGTVNADIGVGYINNLADSNGITDALPDSEALADYIAGLNVYGVVEYQNFRFMAEYVGALDEFAVNELAFDAQGATPNAWHVELGYTTTLGGKETTFALGYDATDEALGLELPEKRMLAAVSVSIFENTALAFEWAHSEDYAEDDGGSGEDANAVTLQLAVEF